MRTILGARVCSMPAKGLLAEISRKKYGFRKDERTTTAAALLGSLSRLVPYDVEILSDENPKYPRWIKSVFPQAKHRTFKGRRGASTGQGELKVGGRDPLFALNHTAAMIRANINRLFRRTWCTTKVSARLEDHLAIYIEFHNTVLTAS